MHNRLDPTFVRAQIELLRHTHPGIWDEGDETLLADMLEAETDLHEFLAAVTENKCDADAKIEGIGDLMSRFKARCDRFEQRSEALRGLMFKIMTQAGVRKVELAAATHSIRNGVPKVIITDETRLPPDCIRIKREPDRIAIKERLSRGEAVPGAELSNSEPQLATRIK